MRIGIYDRFSKSYRSQQLIKEINQLGHTAILLKQWELSLESYNTRPKVIIGGKSVFEDLDLIFIANLGRESSNRAYFRLDLFEWLSNHGVPVINHAHAIRTSRDKAKTFMLLSDHGVPMAPTLITEQPSKVLEFIETHDSCVLKPTIGSQGRGVFFINKNMPKSTILSILDYFSRNFGNGLFLVQKKLETGGFDIRVLVLGDQQISKFKRISDTSGLANLHRGAKPSYCDINISEIALKAATAIGCEFAGVDLIQTPDGLIVSEINSCPGWIGESTLKTIDVPFVLAKYLVTRII